MIRGGNKLGWPLNQLLIYYLGRDGDTRNKITYIPPYNLLNEVIDRGLVFVMGFASSTFVHYSKSFKGHLSMFVDCYFDKTVVWLFGCWEEVKPILKEW